jgi:Heat-labile enterotoxin alpha chain
MFAYSVSLSGPQMPAGAPDPLIEEPRAVDCGCDGPTRAASPRGASAAPPTAPADARSRTPRGPVLSRCASEPAFREYRGGEALQSASRSYRRFDQYQYRSEPGIDGNPMCMGWLVEAMRRIDQSDEAAPQSLLTIVQQMRRDATRRSDGTAAQMLARVGAYQVNASLLSLQKFRLRLTERVPAGSSRDSAINTALTHLSNDLRDGEMALVRLALHPAARPGNPLSTTELRGGYGHALLVQRLRNKEFVVFEANNGAFVYSTRLHTLQALHDYLNVAFNNPAEALVVVPESIQYFARLPSLQAPEPLPQSTPLMGPPDRPCLPENSGVHRLLAATAQESNELSGAALSAAAGDPRPIAHASQGIAYVALRDVAQGRASTLMQATDDIWQRLADPRRRAESIREISAFQEQNRHGLLTDVPHRTRRVGGFHIHVAPRLIDDLRQRFGESRDAEDSRVPYRNDFAELRLAFNTPAAATSSASHGGTDAGGAYSIIIQRQGVSDDFEHDRYELHEPVSGVFRYADFNALSDALTSAINDGYPELGGVAHVDTIYFGHYDDHRSTQEPVAHTAPMPHESLAATITPGGVEPLLGINSGASQTPLVAPPTAQPDFGLDEPPDALPDPGANPRPHVDLRRSADYAQNRQPVALYRPSIVTPSELEARGGFSAEHVAMRNVNLDLHNFDNASNPKLLDSAGYLATFRGERAAVARLSDIDGYVYAVAPTPNMVDVNTSLGSYVRKPENFEVAAMARIDFSQIRGWREVHHGVAGSFIRNPKYRWDVFNQTRTAGAQPQLSRLPLDSGVWSRSGYNAFVSRNNAGVAIAFKQDLNWLHVHFYDSALQKVRRIEARQAAGLDYRGPLTIEAYGGNDTRGTQLYIDAQGVPQVASRHGYAAEDPASRHEFTMGNDGRFHLVKDYDKVLRVGNDGNVYLGTLPSNRNSTNGVFNYMHLQLVHLEDGKYLTTGRSVYQPFVTDTSAGVRSQWALRKPDGSVAIPPRINEHTFRGLTGGQYQLYRFEMDPDSALPDTATHFVTKVPGNRYEGNFLTYVDWIPATHVRETSRWLYQNNAAWLFPDGFYLKSPAPGRLEAHTLDGVLHWWADFDPSSATASFGRRTLSSSYRISQETMNRVREKEERRQRLFELLS